MDWLTEILTAVRNIFPRSFTVLPDEGGVCITLGTKVKSLPPGWYWYWPPLQHVEKMSVTPQAVDLRPQSIQTKDSVDMVVSGAILYKISDARKALLEVQDYDRSIQTLALGVIAGFMGEHESGGLQIDELRDVILTKVREEAVGFGLKIMRVYITDLGYAKNLRILGETTAYKNLGEE